MDKKINLNNAELKISAGFLDQVPTDLPHVVFSGRSNVGKSSVINKITGRNSLARVSSSPGKTITINFFTIDKKFYLVDLPGYGYAKRGDDAIQKWSQLVEGYFRVKIDLKCVVQLVDLKVGLTGDDEMMVDYMNRHGKPYIIVATKADKLNKTEKALCIEKIKNNTYLKKEDIIIPFSTLSKEGIGEVSSHIRNIL